MARRRRRAIAVMNQHPVVCPCVHWGPQRRTATLGTRCSRPTTSITSVICDRLSRPRPPASWGRAVARDDQRLLLRPDRRESARREAPLSGSLSKMRRSHRCPRWQGRRLRVLQGLSSRGDRTDPHARVGARRDARVAGALRPTTVVDRLVWHARRPARRRRTRTLARRGLAATLHGHRPLRELGRGFGRRLPTEITRRAKGGLAGQPGTYVAG